MASHTGGWAIASGELAAKFPDAAIVGADRERAEIRKLVNSSRARTAPETLSDFSDGFSPVAVYAALRAGRIAAMHADRDAGGRTAAARFLGAEVRSPIAPYACAWRAGAEVLQIFCFRESLFRYRIFCERIDLSECSSADKAAESGAAQFFRTSKGSCAAIPASGTISTIFREESVDLRSIRAWDFRALFSRCGRFLLVWEAPRRID